MVAVAGVLLLIATGCPQEQPESGPPFVGQSVRVQVVDDAALAAALRRMAPDWSARSGATVSIQESTARKLLSGDGLAADVVIYPSALLGILADRQWIVPVTPDQRGDASLDWSGVFLTLREWEVRWSDDVLAVPLGTQVPLCYFRGDLLAKFNRAPPQTWDEYHELAEFFHDRANLADAAPSGETAWYGAAEPLTDGTAAMTLLSRAAAYARHPDFFSTLFRLADMEPLIASQPFVRALDELVAARRFGPPGAGRLTPLEAEAAIRNGQCALAIAWPNRAAASDGAADASAAELETPPLGVSVLPLPGARQVWQPEREEFESTALRRVAFLSGQGRAASLAATSAHPDAAWRFIVALSGDAGSDAAGEEGNEWSRLVVPASAATGPIRPSLLQKPRAWAPDYDSALASEFGRAVQETLTLPQAFFAPRIPGREEYLRALDEAVAAALQGMPSRDALAQAAEKWREITRQYGAEQQRAALERSEVRVF